MTRKRFCTNPPPTIGGKDCTELGPDHEKTSCQLVDCRGKLNYDRKNIYRFQFTLKGAL